MPYRLLAKAATRATGRLGWGRGALGALLGIGLAGMLGLVVNHDLAPFLIAPMGAAADASSSTTRTSPSTLPGPCCR